MSLIVGIDKIFQLLIRLSSLNQMFFNFSGTSHPENQGFALFFRLN